MLAARMYDVRDIRLEEIPIPEIAEDEILLKVRAAAICGTDVRMINNGYKGITPETPRILGHEIGGVIAKIGARVTGYEVGQRVAVAPNMGCGICAECVRGDGHLCRTYKALGINLDGGFAEYCVIPARAVQGGNVIVLDDNVSFEEAAINEPLSCVCNGFERCQIGPGDYVMVIGAGPIGVMHAMLARMAGAGRVYINDLSQERLDACKAIDPTFVTVLGDPAEVVMRDTNGAGLDVCITACPAPSAQKQALELCGINGRVNFFGGVPAGKQPVGLDTNLIHYQQLIVSGTTRASLTQFRKTLKYISTGVLDVKPLVTATFALKDIQEGIDRATAAVGMKNIVVMD